ncbi:MAG: transaldolase [Syntrophales bacterium]
MKKNNLLKLESYGQSVWLDALNRPLLTSGELQRFITGDGLSGITSNPAIFEKAIAESNDYDEAVRALAIAGKSAEEIYRTLTVEDIRLAADQLRPVYDRLEGRDGFVSLEVSPHLARDTGGSIAEARALWKAVNRPNAFIKIPATLEGLPAIRQLISEGINVNITLLFGLPRYRQVADAYIAGLEDRLNRGEPIDHVASVASFFLSRIDVLIDPLLEKKITAGGPEGQKAGEVLGEVAIASAKVAYTIFADMFGAPRFTDLLPRGARVQRLLWASTGTKNPAYSDVKYVEPLIGPQTINTLPLETLRAYRDHGKPAARLASELGKAKRVLGTLPKLGIDLDQATQTLEDEGIEKFIKPYDLLLSRLAEKRTALLGGTKRI